ncbi:MAG: thermonuclease family protein [Candidatus Aenigmarchaeota archaeon]|nr:thermonuclease family protein [Candidatus Aenigmarchaeota archaeon]
MVMLRHAIFLLVLFVIFFLISGCVSNEPSEIPDKSIFYKAEHAFVTGIVDGDTIILDTDERVRLLGINTPEKNQELYEEARERLRELVEGKNVTLETDFDQTDQYDRLLRYVFVDGIFVNELLIKEGLATLYIVPPNDRYEKELKYAETFANENRTGLWDNSYYFNCFNITGFVYNPDGDERDYPNEEYVAIRNLCDAPINMTRWTIKDDATNMYTFRELILGAGESFTLHSGGGKETEHELYWSKEDKKGSPIWNNGGDTFYMRDSEGKLVLLERYE